MAQPYVPGAAVDLHGAVLRERADLHRAKHVGAEPVEHESGRHQCRWIAFGVDLPRVRDAGLLEVYQDPHSSLPQLQSGAPIRRQHRVADGHHEAADDRVGFADGERFDTAEVREP